MGKGLHIIRRGTAQVPNQLNPIQFSPTYSHLTREGHTYPSLLHTNIIKEGKLGQEIKGGVVL